MGPALSLCLDPQYRAGVQSPPGDRCCPLSFQHPVRVARPVAGATSACCSQGDHRRVSSSWTGGRLPGTQPSPQAPSGQAEKGPDHPGPPSVIQCTHLLWAYGEGRNRTDRVSPGEETRLKDLISPSFLRSQGAAVKGKKRKGQNRTTVSLCREDGTQGRRCAKTEAEAGGVWLQAQGHRGQPRERGNAGHRRALWSLRRNQPRPRLHLEFLASQEHSDLASGLWPLTATEFSRHKVTCSRRSPCQAAPPVQLASPAPSLPTAPGWPRSP